MGLFSKLLSRQGGRRKSHGHRSASVENSVQRRCRFEAMEPRRLLSASPLVLGSVYLEEDLGSDMHGDRFEVTFSGGATGSELTRLVINGDQGEPGFGIGDVFFDTLDSGLGADHAMPFQIQELRTSDPHASVVAHVEDGSSLLVLEFQDFQAGDYLVFTIDVDEVEYFDPSETDLDLINEGFDPITSGVEFQGSQLSAEFSAPHYLAAAGSGVFWNRYDDALAESGLPLPQDDAGGLRDRSTGAFLDAQQLVNPASISGYVYADNSNDGLRDLHEPGLGGVTLQVIPVDTLEPQVTVFVLTDADGYYEATQLVPGTYRVVEATQPAGYLDGIDSPGTVDGVPRGEPGLGGDSLEAIFLGGGARGIAYNFGEILPASIAGSVHLSDADGNCCCSAGATTPLSDVTIQLLDGDGQVIGETQTDGAGHYAFVGLTPGTFAIVEQTPAGLLDAGARAGQVGGLQRGTVTDANTITQIALMPGEQGREYDFCEHLPSSLSGYVYHDRNDNGLREAGEEPIAHVRVRLFDDGGTQVASSWTDSTGRYAFTGLAAGTYTILETQPANWLDGQDTAGRVDGIHSGQSVSIDTLHNVTLRWGSAGVDYNFGELLPGTISGQVHADMDGDCILDPNEEALANVTIELLGPDGTLLRTTLTGADGRYQFTGLTPGQFAVRELQPAGYFHGTQHAGSGGGLDGTADLITGIPVGSGQDLVDYNFCEIPPASLAGIVYVDPNQDQVRQPDETVLAGVQIELLDGAGVVIATTRTDAAGHYQFTNLYPGEYDVHEWQPSGYFHGGQQAGLPGGDTSVADRIAAIPIGAGQQLTQYNFSELPPGSIAGGVFVSSGPVCGVGPGQPLAGVAITLLDANGRAVATTLTDASGHYAFTDLAPGTYTVREAQPVAYFHGSQYAGSGGGVTDQADVISGVLLPAGRELVGYNFCELRAASLAGYVFQDGSPLITPDGQPPEDLSTVRDGQRTTDDRPIAGVVLELRDGITGVVVPASRALPGTYGDGPIRTVTDANGYYHFDGLPRGNYAVYEIHPDGYVDGIDTPGTTSGLAVNPHQGVSTIILQQLVVLPQNDAILRIPLAYGQTSRENNFSEVLVEGIQVPPLPPPPIPPTWTPPVLVLPPALPWHLGPQGGAGVLPTIPSFGTASGLNMTWHLSVVNGGAPRNQDLEHSPPAATWRTVSYLDSVQWVSMATDQGHWLLPAELQQSLGRPADGVMFGIPGAIPVAGDFNGDGISEMGLYYQGQWFIDLNGNGRWDEEDLWARLGSAEDLPVVGDWDGDGKDDIGIFGPEWPGDERAVRAEPGLPDEANEPQTTPKNMPPEAAEATDGRRILKHTADGDPRLDVIDHVFRFGVTDDAPVAGDWNGDSISTVGVFRGETWYLDLDGDGKFTERDAVFKFGHRGAQPVVGDFNGDGIDEVGVFDHGLWQLDTNGNHQLDGQDQTIRQSGQVGDRPVAGDWNGDGQDDPTIYREAG